MNFARKKPKNFGFSLTYSYLCTLIMNEIIYNIRKQ